MQSISSNIVPVISKLVGATTTSNGTSGSVPSPSAGGNLLFLRGDATFATPALTGSGSPESIVIASIGNIYWDTASSSFYVKQTGDNTNTGWVLGTTGISTIVVTRFTSGSGTFTPTAGMRYVMVEACGGGGGGGGSVATLAGEASLGRSGGGGSYVKVLLTATEFGASRSYNVGNGGAGGNGASGSSTLGTILGTGGAVFSTSCGAGGQTTTASTSVQNVVAGGSVGSSILIGTIILSYSGESADSSLACINPTSSFVIIGQGGGSLVGQGVPQRCDVSTTTAVVTAAAPSSASRGAGGGGTGAAGLNASTLIGLPGIGGMIVFTEYI